MIKISNINVPLNKADTPLQELAAKKLRVNLSDVKEVILLKRSVDARKKKAIQIVYTIAADIKNETVVLRRFANQSNISVYKPYKYNIPIAASPVRPVVVGFGPAGMFAALLIAKSGLRPIVLERGKPADERSRSVELFRKTGILDTESNIQFGEGGAGTFSDGKLNTGINDPRIRYILEPFVEHGAPEDILYNATPHIGTDFLVSVVQNIRHSIIKFGGEVRFNARFTGYETDSHGRLATINYTHNGESYSIHTDSCILAAGHSARDVFRMLNSKNVQLSQKTFAMGLRIEHLQEDLDRCMYGENAGHPALGAADYKLAAHLPNGHSLYTFCMCPGGEVVASSSEENRLVVNGMSCHARDGVNAN
ncbi:MAG: FAD-dependent monooxygenase, partial [Oscillospiraceae bacterium]|nr:FAD-dependent monooxygenase [Oscillospiraceae bacterium]